MASPHPSFLYRTGLLLSLPLLPAAGMFDEKVGRGHRGRAGALTRLEAWGREQRKPNRPLVWFHAPSVGEGLQAQSIITRIRQRHPDWQIAYTHFSPSAENFARNLGADVADYLPYDTQSATRRLMTSLRPSALIFTKLDLWPELATAAHRHGVPVGIVAGTVRPHSSRLSWPARSLLRPGYRVVSRAGAVSADDARRLVRLGVNREVIEVLGDPRFDSVRDKVLAASGDEPLRKFGLGAPTMVAGSTWPGDEAVLLEAFARLHIHRPDARLILVPHEPTPVHLDSITRTAARFGCPEPVRMSAAVGPVPLLLVDSVGLLARLYGVGSMAFVGGGFHGAGLHSVLEPAACGIPVVFGPRWEESRDASLLLEAGGGEALAELGSYEAAESLQALWDDWIGNEIRRAAQGRKALAVVTKGGGAADGSADLIEGLVGATAALPPLLPR
ncbi:MAG: glycosyltransferase N-terminal domain-containing protein [Gemmatimonadota bacterium]